MTHESIPSAGPNLYGQHDNNGNDILRTPRDGLDVKAHAPRTPMLHSRWNMETLVYIQVEEILFVVPRDAFKEFGDFSPFENFRVYRPSSGTSVTVPGMTRDSPLVFEDVKLGEMENFLTVICPEGHPADAPVVDEDNALEYWDGVLRLAKKWNHGKAIAKAIYAILNLGTVRSSKDAAALLRIGKENALDDLMRTSAIHLICDTTLGLKELSKEPYALEWEIIARIVEARLKAPIPFVRTTHIKGRSSTQSTCPQCKTSYFTTSGSLGICCHGAEKGFEASFFANTIVDTNSDVNFADDH